MNIISLSGLVPEQICDIVRFTGYNGSQRISNYCGYAADYISQVLEDPRFDGAVFPRSCDSCRILGSYLLNAKNKFIYQFPSPARQDQFAVQYLAAEIQQYKSALERHYHIQISDIKERIQLINERNRELAKLYENIQYVSYAFYLEMINSLLSLPLYQQKLILHIERSPGGNKRVYLIGSFLTNIELIRQIESQGLLIVGDNLTQSKRLFSTGEISAVGNLYQNIALGMLCGQKSPTQNSFKYMIEQDLAEIKAKKVQGVIFITQKFCEAYDYMFSVYKKVLDDLNIPVLQLTMSDSMDVRQADFAIEAFAGIL